MSSEDNISRVSFIADFEGDVAKLIADEQLPETLRVLPLRNMVVFPCVTSPISIGRETSLQLVKEAEETGQPIAMFTQKDPKKENPSRRDLYPYGVAAHVMKVLELPDGSTQAILQPTCRIHLGQETGRKPYLEVEVDKLDDKFPRRKDAKFTYAMMVHELRDLSKQFVDAYDEIPSEAMLPMLNMKNDSFLVNFVCSIFPFPVDHKMKLLGEADIVERTVKVMKELNVQLKLIELRNDIHERTQADINTQQREYFLQQQMRNIQDELGDGNTPEKDSDELRAKAKAKKWTKETGEAFEREVAKLERLHPQSPDYNVQYTYLTTLLSLPWGEATKDNLTLGRARRILDRDHYGMEKVKERILEHLAVMQLRGDLKSPIVCLYGPPGVGKTSLGRSIAASLGRKYVRISLGGLHDESEIRGHRRTYIGAMPGRIIKNIAKAGTSNPVFVLDEIDKITESNVNGDPSSALLEVLDPEQNVAFHDNYLDLDYDLSKVLFIATANNIQSIPAPLLDRMELIEVSGYCTEEKVEIARRHLFPRQKEENGLKEKCGRLNVTKAAIEKIIEGYTRESGVRALDKQLSKLCRRLALKYATDGALDVASVTPETVETLLGKPTFTRDTYQGNETAGVVTGLAWTAVGGEILFIESSLSKGKGSKLTLTGNLGDVMKESAMLALEYIKAHAESLGLRAEVFEEWNIHLHVPEGAVPKDGPSAGITMATSLASLLTQRRVRDHVAMTGEITLRGRVLPVGGIKEKILAARRAGITDIVICEDNRKDIEEIPEMYLGGLTFHYVRTISEVWQYALTQEKVADAKEI